MELRDKFMKLQDCYRIFNENYFDTNFAVITENNRQVQFNFRQSKLWKFFGISKKFIKGEGFNGNDYYSFTSLLGNKYDYINAKRDDIFTEKSEEVILSYLTMPILDGISMKFLVESDNIIYIYINSGNDIKDGKLLTLEFDGEKYYIPTEVKDLKEREDLLNIVNNGKVEIISLLYKRKKENDRRIDRIEPTAKNDELFKETALFLSNLGLSEFNYSDEQISDIIYSSQFGNTRLYSPSDFGLPSSIGRQKMNKNAYDALMMCKTMLLQMMEERDYYKEVAEDAISFLYDKENKSNVLSRILDKRKNS